MAAGKRGPVKLVYGLSVVVAGVALLGVRTAAACGGGGVTSSRGVVMSAQRILVSARSAGTTDIVMQVGVPQTTSDYGVLVPVPSEPTIDSEPVPAAELDELDELTAPQIFVNSGSSGGSGCGCGAASAPDSTKGSPRSVSVSAPVNIGPVVAVSLTGDDAGVIQAWLDDNGFQLPGADAATLTTFVGPGKYFLAIRRSERAATNGPTSVGIHYTLQGDHRQLSLSFARIGAAPTVAFTVFIAARQPLAPSSPFVGLTLDDLDAAALRARDYPRALEDAVALRESKAFLLEGVTPKDSIRSLPTLAALLDDGAVVTRATTILARDALDADAFFTTPVTRDIPNVRYASAPTPRAVYAGLGPLGVLLLAGLRRRTRRAS